MVTSKARAQRTNEADALKTGGGDGTFDGMEARVAKLESLAEDTRNTLDSMGRELIRIEAKLDKLADTVHALSGTVDKLGSTLEKLADKFDKLGNDVSELKGRVSAMPTTFQLLGMVLAIMGATFAFIRFGLSGL
jgi:chromosome segregation ATPase